jgi:hypothetical protein
VGCSTSVVDATGLVSDTTEALFHIKISFLEYLVPVKVLLSSPERDDNTFSLKGKAICW